MPHIAKLLELGQAQRVLREQCQAALGALDHIHIGICVVRPDGTVIITNAEANRLLVEERGISINRNRKLRCRRNDEHATLLNALVASSMASSTKSGRMSGHFFSLTNGSGQTVLLVEVSPLRDNLDEITEDSRRSLVTLIDPDYSDPLNTARLAAAYKLTRAESAVCRLLVDGWTNREIAQNRRVSAETIKSQVTSIARKTGANRRADLIRLAAKISPPVGIRRHAK